MLGIKWKGRKAGKFLYREGSNNFHRLLALKVKLTVQNFFSICFAVAPKKPTMETANLSKALDYYYLEKWVKKDEKRFIQAQWTSSQTAPKDT